MLWHVISVLGDVWNQCGGPNNPSNRYIQKMFEIFSKRTQSLVIRWWFWIHLESCHSRDYADLTYSHIQKTWLHELCILEYQMAGEYCLRYVCLFIYLFFLCKLFVSTHTLKLSVTCGLYKVTEVIYGMYFPFVKHIQMTPTSLTCDLDLDTVMQQKVWCLS